VIARREILDVSTGTCAYTLAGSPIPCAAALATLDELEGGLVDNAATVGAFLLEQLRARLERHELVGDIRGCGLILGIELVADRASRRPAAEHARAVVYRSFELGLISIYSGTRSNVIELTPPLTLTREDAELAVGILDQALDDVANGRFDTAKLSAYEGW
jgi:4-aminobutyrate aminotransferase